MNQTKFMRADEIANGFNSVEDRKYWKASVAGTRVNPEVHFNSRASMVQVNYRITSDDFTVTFSRSNAAFGDFLASAWRSMTQVLASLKAAGLPFAAPIGGVNEGLLRLEYDPFSKAMTAHIANFGDDWLSADPAPFKVPERNNSENPPSELDEV